MNMKKVIAIAFLLFAVVGIVGASVFTYFGSMQTDFNVKQAIRLDNQDHDKPVVQEFTVTGGDIVNSSHTFNNDARIDANITVITDGLSGGITITYYYTNGSVINFPMVLQSESELDFIMQYSFDLNIASGSYSLRTYFKASEL